MTRLPLLIAAALLLSACAPMLVQRPLTPAASFSGPRLEDDWLVSFDGARLGLKRWLPAGEP